MKYRKKPVVVDALQFTGENEAEVIEFLGDNLLSFGAGQVSYANTLHDSELTSYEGEWIVKGSSDGDFYPCDADVFDEIYEPVGQTIDLAGQGIASEEAFS